MQNTLVSYSLFVALNCSLFFLTTRGSAQIERPFNTLFEKIQNQKGIAESTRFMGIIHACQSDLPKALEFFKKVLQIETQLQNKNGMAAKPTRQGTRLGLSLSYDIVKAHGGELKVETKA